MPSIIKPGTELFFEYHCWESEQSQDAKLWHHSHQRVAVLECTNFDECGDMTLEERIEAAMPLVYKVKFQDGFVWDAFEDELLESESSYERPDPQIQKENLVIVE